MYIYIYHIYISHIYIYMYNIIYCTQPACKCFSQWGLSKGELAGSRGFFPDESGPLGPPQKRRSQSLEPYPSYRMLYYIYISILWLMLILDQTVFFCSLVPPTSMTGTENWTFFYGTSSAEPRARPKHHFRCGCSAVFRFSFLSLGWWRQQRPIIQDYVCVWVKTQNLSFFFLEHPNW